MGAYDSPGGVSNPMPGLDGIDRLLAGPGTSTVGAGDTDSATMAAEAGTHGSSAFVVPGFGSLVNGDRVDVAPGDVLVSTQAASYGAQPDPLTHIGADLGNSHAGEGSVVTSHHPNNAGVPSLETQLQAARRPS